MPENPERVVRTNYPSNSHKARAKKEEKPVEDKKVEKVVTGTVIQRKKPLGRKIMDTFLADSLSNVGHYVFFDVLLPAAKNTMVDAATQGFERMVMGESYRRGGTSSARSGSGSRHTSYNKMHAPNREDRSSQQRTMSTRGRANHEFDEIVLETRGEAEDVLDRLTELIREYDTATVSDLYEMVGITGNFTDDRYGWTDVRGLGGISRVSGGGYLLDLSRPVALD